MKIFRAPHGLTPAAAFFMRVVKADTGFLLARDPDTIRAPDVAYIASDNLPAIWAVRSVLAGAPDLGRGGPFADRTGEVDDRIM